MGRFVADMTGPVGGGKFQQYVKQIMNAEREPVRQIEARKTKEGERLKLLQDFQGKVRKLPEAYKELDSFKKFRELKADWPAKDMIDVFIDKDVAQPGEYQLEVTQLAGRKSMISEGFGSREDEIGIGFFTYNLPSGDSKSVFIGPGSNTLSGLVQAINKEKGLGVTASLINDGTNEDRPWRVVVAGKKGGMENDMDFPEFYFLDGDFRLVSDDERSAQNAIVKFNGFEIMSSENKFELLPGVVIDLKQAKEDFEFTLVISEDPIKIAGKVKALVDSLNSVLEFINKQNQVDQNSDTSNTFAGDSALFGIESRLRSWVFESFKVSDPEIDEDDFFMRLSDLGIQFQKTGLLNFNEEKFVKVMNENFDHVAYLFAGPGNFIENLSRLTNSLIVPGTGVVSSRETGIRQRIKRMDDDIGRKEMNLQKREQALKRKFSSLESAMANMQSQQAYMNQAMAGGGQG